jgi:hypothetical protein
LGTAARRARWRAALEHGSRKSVVEGPTRSPSMMQAAWVPERGGRRPTYYLHGLTSDGGPTHYCCHCHCHSHSPQPPQQPLPATAALRRARAERRAGSSWQLTADISHWQLAALAAAGSAGSWRHTPHAPWAHNQNLASELDELLLLFRPQPKCFDRKPPRSRAGRP